MEQTKLIDQFDDRLFGFIGLYGATGSQRATVAIETDCGRETIGVPLAFTQALAEPRTPHVSPDSGDEGERMAVG